MQKKYLKKPNLYVLLFNYKQHLRLKLTFFKGDKTLSKSKIFELVISLVTFYLKIK